MNKDVLRQTIIVLLVLATIVVNGLANALPLNGLTTGEISDRFEVYFVPAGYVFSIWGLIYLGLIAYAIYQALPSQRHNPRLRSIAGFFVLASFANIAWLFLWHYEQFPWTLAAMLLLLLCLIAIYLRLGTGLGKVPFAETWLVRLPFSIYLGWISVATIANVTSLLDYLNWDGFGLSPEAWMLIILAVVVVIAGLMSFTRRDIAYVLVILWALAGIALKHISVTLVSTATWVAFGLVGIFFIYTLLKPKPALQ
ncbi:MAG: tryptophan-rich sensory protein [Anaerolineales bacterium]